MFRVAVIIPCYNEEKNISAVVTSIHNNNNSALYQLVPVVINDRSTDRTSEIAASEDCVLINLPVNLGIGGAVQTGFRYALEHNFDAAIQMDGDGQHPAGEVGKLVIPIMENMADVVIGSRFINNEGFQSFFLRRIGIRFFKHLLKHFVHQTITDSTSGFRIVNKKVLPVVAFNYPDDYPEPVAVIIFARHKFRIMETAVEMKERQSGQSTIGGLSSVYYMLKVSLAICYTYFKK